MENRTFTIDNNKKVVSITVLCEALGVSRPTIYNWLEKNRYNIRDYCVLIRIADFKTGNKSNAVKKFESRTSKAPNRVEKYYFLEEFIYKFVEKWKSEKCSSLPIDSPVTKDEVSKLYYEILILVEEMLEEEERSNATKQMPWADMPIVDSEIVGHIISWYRSYFKEEISDKDRSSVRSSIKYLTFSNDWILSLCFCGMKDMLYSLTEEENKGVKSED